MVGWAALGSAALALVILVGTRKAGIKPITVVGAAAFATLAAIGLFGGRSGQSLVATFGSGVCALAIGATMLVSVVTIPFTEHYARASVPREQWSSPSFHAINRRVSAVWAGAVLGIGLCRIADGILSTAGVSYIVDVTLGWVMPALLLILVVRLTGRITTAADPRVDSGSADSSSPEPTRARQSRQT